MKAHFFRLIGAAVACTSLLAACGGGGGGGTPTATTPATTPPTTSFALSAGYKAYIASGSDKSFKVAVTTLTAAAPSCVGSTAHIVTTPASQTTFEGFTAYPVTQDSTLTLVAPCALTASPTHGTTYYNANYVPIGLSITGGDYSKFDSAQPDQLALPASVGITDTATTFDTLTSYTDSTKSQRTGTRTLSYRIVADGNSTTTAIANIITVFSDVATTPNVLSTQTSSYRMAVDGTLTLLSIDVQFSHYTDTTEPHLVYTPTN